MRFAVALVGTLAIGTIGCGEEMTVIEGSGSVGSAQNPIYGGAPPNAAYHDAVVSLHQVVNGTQVYIAPFCSGTLIRKDVVLTAAHCLTTTRGKKVVPTSPGQVAVYVGDQPATDILQHLYLVSEISVHPRYNPTRILNDVALIRLHTEVTEPVDPVEPLPSSLGLTNADIGATINFAGFGTTENGSMGVKLQADGELSGFGCAVQGCPDGGDPDTQISYSQPSSGPCSGDSGGPAFIDRGSSTYVAGITSYGDYYCTLYGVSTRVDAFEGFIADFTLPDPTPDCSYDGSCNPACPVGADPDCGPGESCGNGTCDVGESCDGRDGTMACADCPGKPNGKPSGRYCYVNGVCEGPGC